MRCMWDCMEAVGPDLLEKRDEQLDRAVVNL